MLINEDLNYFRSKSWKHLQWAKKGAKKQQEIINLHDEGWWKGQAPCFI
jgi:hypothetical protein